MNHINIGNKFKYISDWKLDKIVSNEKNIIKKIEIYNYFERKNIKKIIKYLNTKKFSYLEEKKEFPRLFNILLSQNNKNITGKGQILNNEKLPKFYYYVDFVKVLNHRGRPILLKIYRNKSKEKSFSKIELTYCYYKKNYNLYFLDWLNGLKGINEIIKKITTKINFLGYSEDFSQKIEFENFLNNILENKTKSNKSYKNKILKILSV